MKTFRQKLNLRLEEKKNEVENQELKKLLDEIQIYIKSIEVQEEQMVNKSYEDGYRDKELNRGFKSSYYKETYKIHDFLKSLTKTN